VAEQLESIYELLRVGRGLQGEPADDGVVEIRLDLPSFGAELAPILLAYEILPQHVWMPLTTVVAGEPELVWDADDALVPTHAPIPSLAVENRYEGHGDDVTRAPGDEETPP
jgi:hypothetical protein